MDTKLDAKLCEKYPYLFADRRASMQNTCMCWGFECGDGWYNLLDEAGSKLEPLCKQEYERILALEKPWYKYIRAVVGFTTRIHMSWLFHILYRLVTRIMPGVYNSPFSWYGGGPRASQVKEKYGTLRFYLTHGTEEMYAITDKAERQSSKTCETCGEPGKVRGKYWLYTACTKHIKKD